MKILSITLLALYAALNAFLAAAGPLTHRRAGVTTLALPTAAFVLAAGLLVHGACTRSTWTVIAGLLVASVAPILFGALVEGSNVLLHHAVRAVVAALIAVCWALAHSPTQPD